MKDNTMRAPLLKAGAVLLVFVLLVSLTSASPDASGLNPFLQIIIGAFRLVQWAIAMAIGLSFCIAFLIGIFLFAVFLVNRETAASMYQAVKKNVCALCQPICARFATAGLCRDTPSCCGVAPAPVTEAAAPDTSFKEELRGIVADEVRRVSESQQALSDQFAALTGKIQAMEEKSGDFASADQLGAIASELATSGKTLAAVQAQVTTLEGKISETGQQLQGITPEKMLGDIPARLQKLEQPKAEQPAFDPAPLTASIENLQMEIEELKKKKGPAAPAKTKKKA
ncbi:MAG: hypothetical protein FWG62_02695 [Proteobacteria bacterium]|nr:hypothetical protein [Pseudomonadota bacterium]